ncbi:MAG: hypothetical protein ACP5HG_08245 [Anaerolineae bacterium]
MTETGLKSAIEKFARDLAGKAESYVEDISTLEIRTFTTPSAQITSVARSGLDLNDPGLAERLRLRAYTRIDLDCDTTVCLPVDENDQIDRSVWDIHQSMVNQALKTRETMLQAMGDALTSALEALQRVTG